MPQLDADVIIVGARVAGASLAAKLGDAGHRVLLVDRAGFPSPTLSTHFFRGAHAVSVLDSLDLLVDVLATGCPPLTCQYMYIDGSAEPVVEDPQDPGEIGYALSVRRVTLDHLLVERALRSPHVTLLDKTRVTDVVCDDGRVVGVEIVDSNGSRDLQAYAVIGADGRHSSIAKLAKPRIEESEPPHRALYYCYVTDFVGPSGGTPDGAEFSRLGDEVAYVFPSDGGHTCIALSINMRRFPELRADRLGFFERRLSAHRGIYERFQSASRESGVLGSPGDPNYVRIPCGAGWALLGDAGMHQDPWSGRGIDMATVHSTFLAHALDDWLSGRVPESTAFDRYHQQRNAHGLEIYRKTVALSVNLDQPR